MLFSDFYSTVVWEITFAPVIFDVRGVSGIFSRKLKRWYIKSCTLKRYTHQIFISLHSYDKYFIYFHKLDRKIHAYEKYMIKTSVMEPLPS